MGPVPACGTGFHLNFKPKFTSQRLSRAVRPRKPLGLTPLAQLAPSWLPPVMTVFQHDIAVTIAGLKTFVYCEWV